MKNKKTKQIIIITLLAIALLLTLTIFLQQDNFSNNNQINENEIVKREIKNLTENDFEKIQSLFKESDFMLNDNGKLRASVRGEEYLFLEGTINSNTPKNLKKILKENPKIHTVVLTNVPGSMDDEANLNISLLFRKKGLNTYVPSKGSVASGGTDMYLAGNNRYIGKSTTIGVHSWAYPKIFGLHYKAGSDFPKEDPLHQPYIKYYKQINIPEDFYWFTLNQAGVEDSYEMSITEMQQFNMFTQIINESQNKNNFIIPNFKIEKSYDETLKAFTKKIEVFGIPIYAVPKVENQKLIHAANVMAQYLDNNEDGIPDNIKVVKEMQKNKAFVVMWKEENDINIAIPKERIGQDLGNDETNPNFVKNNKQGDFDACLEEILHIITYSGYSKAYPEIFGENPNSKIAKAMDKARGGYFKKIPREYPENSWYSYYDKTCTYECMVVEYHYWALTSILGAQENRFEEINEEWKLNTKEKVEEKDKDIYALLTNPEYKFPTKLPNGNYRGQNE